MKVVGVLGTGVMGAGIAQIAAQSGLEVLFWNRKRDSVDRGLANVKKGLGRLFKKDRISQQEHDHCVARIRGVVAIEELKSAVIILEAVP